MAKSKYETIILPRLDEIKKWVSEGLTDKEIIDRLGISKSTWYKHKSDIEEFSDTINICRKPKIEELENTMFQLANGFSVDKKFSKVLKNPDGSERIASGVETVYYPPNFNALRFLLTNWSEKYSHDPALMRLRREEFEHKKKMDEENSW